jgi:hypothetical protein
MSKTTPNKETIRRICLLQGGTECYILVDNDSDYIDVFTNIQDQNIPACLVELVEWCGMKFCLLNENSEIGSINKIRTKGEKILPIKL